MLFVRSVPERISNPPNRWLHAEIDWAEADGERGPPIAHLEVQEELTRTALQENKSPDLGFRWSINPYRGCSHACAYCYARPTHEYLGWGAGTDFERRLVVKTNLPELLRAELQARRWTGEKIVFSGNTDCYQPLEAHWQLTRRCLEVCRDFKNPVGIVTKGTLIRRDLALLSAIAGQQSAGRRGAEVFVSIPLLDPETARVIEPGAPPPERRLAALAALSEAGVETGIMIAPLIPGLNEHAIPALLERARECGASRASMTLLRLPGSVRPVFEARVKERLPLRADKILRSVRDMRGGRMNESSFGARMRGVGPRWQSIADLFAQHARRLELATGFVREGSTAPQPSGSRGVRQLSIMWD